MSSKYPISADIRKDLKAVEGRLAAVAAAPGGTLQEACAATLEAGGKRLRPALVLVCGTAGSYDLDALMPHAVAVELVHMASLVHDDILDDAPTRRGRPSVHARWGQAMGVAAGDYLFSKAFEALAGSGLAEGAGILASTAFDLTAGELMQREGAYRTDISRDAYLARIRAKTASLFEASCLLGALASGAGAPTIEALGSYGENLGMAFQIYDDVLDMVGDAEALGKAVGADFRDGTLTLPMMLAAESLGRDDWLREAMAASGSADSVAAALATVAETDAANRSKEIARGYVETAVGAVSRVNPDALRRTLADIGKYVIERYD